VVNNKKLNAKEVTSSLKSNTDNLYYGLGLFYDDYLYPTNLLNTNNYSLLSLTNSLFNLEEAYENRLDLKHITYDALSTSLGLATKTYAPLSYINTLNLFRADFDENA